MLQNKKKNRNLVHGLTIFHKKCFGHYIVKWDTFEYKYRVFTEYTVKMKGLHISNEI